ncbi:ATP-binding protein [Amylibacter sp.]|nr:ATP-binding protein [Amylibacter sp.]MDA9895560.1 ATP-binding protein [Amylibacter sp.]MDA9911357.1 ATP-binding protein [Amylibacter sp.]MDB9727313.1 ATP-binding protein [Amylibacter sp.]MDC1409402.1 ATP-binding protein [Amylibacter sp.]
MNFELKGYRSVILVGLGLLALLLGLMINKLFSEYQDLLIVEDTIFTGQDYYQLDGQLADLDITLLEQITNNNLSKEELLLKVDTVLNKLLVLESSQSGVILGYNEEVRVLMRPIDQFVNETISIIDKEDEISFEDILILREMVKKVRPKISKNAFLVYRLAVVRSQEHRKNFSKQLIWTAGSTVFFLIMLSGLLLLLDRMLRSAIRRADELTASSRQLAITVAGSMDAIIIADGYSKIIEYNTSAQGVFGWSREEIIGKTMEELFFRKGLRDAYKNAMAQSLELSNTNVVDGVRVELTAWRKNGEEFEVELNMTYVERNNDAIYMAYIRDISDRKVAEKILIEARDRAERTDKAKSQFLAVMSHEMRTPLAGIIGVMDLLKTTKLTKKQDHYVQIATSSGEIMLEHINEALDITRIEGGALNLSPQEFNLPDLVRSLVDILKPLANEKKLNLDLQIDNKIKTNFMGDSLRIRQILTNLLGNSIKFTDKGSIKFVISYSHGSDTSKLKFKITDTGKGIAPEDHKKIFDDFVVISSGGKQQTRGDGLGLSISRKIARQMGGDIIVESNINEGATFILSLPLKQVAKTDVVELKGLDIPVENFKKINVLVVEDSITNREVLCDMLEGMGHNVRSATNGLETLNQAKKQLFDIIFMDINMPIMGGIEATQKIRSGGGLNSKTYIAGLTAHGSDEFGVEAKESGMDCYITKPIRLAALRKIISDVISDSSFETIGELSPVLMELFETLGREKALGVGWVFFEELEQFIKQYDQDFFGKDNNALAEAAHKLKGASAMFGQELLEKQLAQLEFDARKYATKDLTDRIRSLEGIAKHSEAIFSNYVSLIIK